MITTVELEKATGRSALKPHSLAAGMPGLVMLQVERAYAGRGDWHTVDEALRAMTSQPLSGHPDACSLFRGAPAVAYTMHTADRRGSQQALAKLDDHIIRVTKHRLQQAYERIDRAELPALREYDLISGLTGIGVYLLCRFGGGDLLEGVLSYLVRLSQPLTVDGTPLPGWWSANGPADRPSSQWPGGHGNLGMAHGITGPLALLATAHRRGIHVLGQVAAIERICGWLDRWQCGPARRTWWPGLISHQELHTGIVQQPGP